MQITDTHTHVWAPPSREHPWINTRVMTDVAEYQTGPLFGAEDLKAAMATVGVDRAVVVNFALTDVTDNVATIQAVEDNKSLFGIVTIDELAPDAADRLRALMATDGIIGLRFGAVCPHDQMWEAFDPTVSWLDTVRERPALWEAIEETGAIVQILPHYAQLDQVIRLVEAYPTVSYIIDHFALAGPDTPPEAEPFASLAVLADYDVSLKLSEVVHRSNEGYPYRDMHGHVTWLLETFGREHLLWGSDYPNVSDQATYEEATRWIEEIETLSKQDRRWIYDRAFDRLVS